MSGSPSTVALSLVAHTNVGKTTLARTLLQRDIGEVRDEAHVTLEAERQTMIETPAGDRLELWDTPGFGDSLRLAQRLAREGNPIGWFLNEVWDRWRDRARWSSQNAVRNVLEQADVVLYLVNAAEQPGDVGYLDAELKVLDLLGKPVLVLLNQTGPPRGPQAEAAELQRWLERCTGFPCVREVLALDAFARCWVQEDALLAAVAPLLGPTPHAAFARLRAAWRQRQHATWRASCAVLAERLARAALDRAEVAHAGWTGRVREFGSALGLPAGATATPREQAMQVLAERLDTDLRTSTDRLIALHGLGGRASAIVQQRLAEHFALREPVSEGKAAIVGGMVSGALVGLKADILSGGLTLGGGLLAGGVLGALGAMGLARGVNQLRGVAKPTLAWSDAVLDELARSALLGYLAVAHFGRGRGDWIESEHPRIWSAAVDALLVERQPALHRVWAMRATASEEALRALLEPVLADAIRALLLRLYPQSGAVFEAPGG